MVILSFIVQLIGATMLLLYAVRMVRTGIERAFGASFQRVVTRTSNAASAAMSGRSFEDSHANGNSVTIMAANVM